MRQEIRITSDGAKARYDEQFNELDLMYLYNPQRKKGFSSKLLPVWKEPYRVVKRINDEVYKIQRSPRSKMNEVNLNRLSEYNGDPEEWN